MPSVELSRFRIKAGQSALADEWLAFLNEHMADTLLTLEGEKMFVETIHRETLDGCDYLYWYCIRGENGRDVRDSDSYVDIRHLQYWAACIDEAYGEHIIPARVVMLPHRVRKAMR